jgi:MoaA/NifB/PqqE/SkfB family radical SAM enzyme
VNQKESCAIILSPSCENNCLFCGGAKKVSKSELKKQEVKVLKNIIGFRKQGHTKIEISGTDPIEYKNLIKLVKYLIKIGFNFIQLSTHGNLLKNKTLVEELILAGITKFRIPIYGSNPFVHDSITQKKGSFIDVITGLKNINSISEKLSKRIELQISSLIMKHNINDLTKIVDLVKKIKLNEFYFSIPCILHNDFSYYVPIKDLSQPLKKLIKYAKQVDQKINFKEIPFCTFENENDPMKNIDNTNLPPSLGKFNQPPKQYQTNTIDLPSYREKTKLKMCNMCDYNKFCNGFFKNDIKKFGTGDLKPISIKEMKIN